MKTYITYKFPDSTPLSTINSPSFPKSLDLPFIPMKGSKFNLSETHYTNDGNTFDTFNAFIVTNVTYDFNITTQESFVSIALKPDK